ncbi:ornithine carbamoyltransferase [Pelagibacterales bacterium SAG-MED05]|nr:ornithine carbamoyltransferase [Pelagibacterales bacterium SAG-MED05]
MKNFIDISDLSSKALRSIIEEAKLRKINRKNLNKSAPDEDKPFEGKSMAMIFEKPSTRTRMSFDIAVKQLGGSSIILNPDVIHYGKGDETLKDTAKVLTEYVDIVMLRTSSHKNLEEFGKHLDIPIINGLSDKSHPCQIMSDIMTFEETKGLITGKVISWLGDGNNNMSNSLIEAAGKFGFQLKIGCPTKYMPDKRILNWAKKNKVNLLVTKKPEEAVKDSDCVMTDKWVSMNDKVNKKLKKKHLKNYQVNKKLMLKAKSDTIFMHCLPVGRGEEVTDEVIDGKQSVVWRQALNRVHAQKSIINWCLN